ncbi:MAG TPA: ABC transporter permease [Candidatus Acidoferrum sp.]
MFGEWFGPKRKSSDFGDEIKAHIQLETERLRGQGLSEEDARAATRRSFGNVMQIEERFYEARRWLWWDHLWQDFRFGQRMLAKNPGFTSIALLALALGIGANTAMFSVIEAVLLRPLSYSNADQLLSVVSMWQRGGVTTPFSCSPPDFFDWRDQNRSFTSMFAFHTSERALTGRGDARRVRAVVTMAGIFPTLQAHPIVGREFTAEENRKGADHIAILGYDFWQAEFGGMPDAVGKTIELDSEPYKIIGVMPRDFRFPLRGSDVYLPIGFDDKVMTQRGAHYLQVLGRLKPGVSVAQANEDLVAIMAELRRLYPDKDGKWGVQAERLSRRMVGDIRPALLVLLGAVGLVALIACANVSNLLLARATARQREIAMRRALGAGRLRIVRQILTESLMLATFAGAASLLLAHWALLAIVRFGPKDIPRLASIGLNTTVLVFTLGVSVVSALLFAVIPALRSSRMEVSGLLKMSGSSSRESGRARSILLVGEVALSMMLLAGAGLLVRSFVGLRSLSPGFEPQGVLTLDVSVPDAHYKNSRALESYWDQTVAALRGLPGVTSVAATTPLPLSGDDWSSSFSVAGRNIPEKDQPSAELRWVTPNCFRTLGIPLRRGRTFTDADRLGASRVLLISETAARMFFPAGDAIGQKVNFGANGGYEKNEGEIVGIVGDVRHFGLDAPIAPTFYVPLSQAGMDGATLVIRAQVSPAALGQPARKLVQGIDRDALVGQPVMFQTLLADSLGQRRFYMMLLGAFAALALVLAAVGLYGVISYSVAQRTQEIGIRVALGAARWQVLSMVMKNGLRLVVLGLAVGEGMALMLHRTMQSLLVGVSATDALTLLMAAAVLLIVTILGCYVPAWRAARMDPLVALRFE